MPHTLFVRAASTRANCAFSGSLRLAFFLVVAALLALPAGCAPEPKSVPNESINQANFYADIQSLKSRQQETRKRLEDMESRLGGQGEGANLDDLNQRMTRLEDAVSRIAASLSLDVGLRSSAGAAVSQPAARDEDTPARTDVPARTTPNAAVGGLGSDDPGESIYSMGLEAYNAKNYDRAMSLFAEMLKTYPTHRLAPNALFWQADANFQTGDLARTALLCDDLVKKYPNNPLVPAAMIKQANAFKRLGKPQPAKILLQDVVTRFPSSPEARVAQAQLREMR